MAAADLSLLTSITRRAPFNTFRLEIGGQLGDSISVHCKVCHRIIAVESILNLVAGCLPSGDRFVYEHSTRNPQ